MRPGVSPPPQVFSVRGFEALFPHTEILGCCSLSCSPIVPPSFICMQMWDHPVCKLPPHRVHQPPPCLLHQPPPCLPRSSSGCLACHGPPDAALPAMVLQMLPCLPRSSRCCLACPGPPDAALLRVLSFQLPVSALPTSLDECFFNSLVVRLPYSSIFSQSWLVFVFKFLLSFFWSCEEEQCVYLRLHLGQESILSSSSKSNSKL